MGQHWVRLGDVVFNIWYFKQGCHVLFEEAVEQGWLHDLNKQGYLEIEVKVLQLKFSQKFLDKNYDVSNNGDMVELYRPSLPIVGGPVGVAAEVVVPKGQGSKKRALTQKDSWAELFKVMGPQAMMDSNDRLRDGGEEGDAAAASGVNRRQRCHPPLWVVLSQWC